MESIGKIHRNKKSSVILDLGDLYKSNNERIESIIEFYKNLYELPILQLNFDITKELFNYCKNRSFFLNVLAFQDERIFLKRSISTNLNWELPGGAIRSKGSESIQDATARIIDRDIPGIEFSEIRPVATIVKMYKWKSNTITHKGLAVMGRVRYPSAKELLKNEDIKGRFVRFDDDEEISRLQEFENIILKGAIHILEQNKQPQEHSIDDEIDSVHEIPRWAKALHNNFIRPFGKKFSSNIIHKHILEDAIKRKNISILDIACGDDDFIFKLAREASFCIANDIAWNSVKNVAEKKPTNINNLFFTNHDARNLPFKYKFDLTICKNLIHHLNSREDLEDLLLSMKAVSKNILIIDPDDPKKSSIRARIWNWYYRVLLKDQGNNFMHRELFDQTINEYFEESKIDTKIIHTIKGDYLFSCINLDGLSKVFIDFDISNLKAIIFDFDGVIADTESLFIKALISTLINWNILITREEYIDIDLMKGKDLLEHLYNSKIIKNSKDVSSIREQAYSKYIRLLRKKAKLMPNVIDTLTVLKKKYKIAIASSSRLEFIMIILNKFGLVSYFDQVISRESVAHLKPSPDCYIEVLKALEINENECIAIEDSPRGLMAARAAQIKTIVIPNELTSNFEYENHLLINDLSELLTILKCK